MKINRIVEHNHINGLTSLTINSSELRDLEGKLTDEHYKKLLKISQHDSSLQVATAIFNEEAFYKLILLELDETRNLTTNGRSLKEVSDFMKLNNVTTDNLFNGNGLLSRSWAEDAYKYYTYFDYRKFGYLLATPPLPNEQAATNNGCWYLVDGNHRALSLLAKIKLDGFGYEPINVVLTHFERASLAAQGITI